MIRNAICSIEDEMNLNGCMVLDPRCIDRVAATVRAEDITDPTERIVFEAMLRERAVLQSTAVSAEFVEHLLRHRMNYRRARTAMVNYVLRRQCCPCVSLLDHYIANLLECWKARTMAEATDAINEAMVSDGDLSVARASMALAIKSIKDRVPNAAPLKSLNQAVHEMADDFCRDESEDIRTAISSLDRAIGKLRPGSLIIIGGRTSQGKTALACQFAYEASVKQRKPVVFVSMEMAAMELARRFVSVQTKQSLRQLETAPNDIIVEAASELESAPLYIFDQSRVGVEEIRRLIEQQQNHGGMSMLIVDYIQIAKVSGSNAKRYEQIGELTHELKGIAMEYRVPVVALAQVNRAAMGQKDPMPQLHHLRESGDIEQDADIVLFVHRLEGEQGDNKRARIIIAKNRQLGETGFIETVWMPSKGMFVESVPDNYEPAFENF